MAELSDKDKQFIKELRKQHENGDLSRRQALKLGGAVGLGGLLGGGGAYAATQDAQAQASTTDDDGNVGTPNNPLDVFADGIDSNSVITDSAVINTNEVYIQGTSPNSPSTGDIWIDNDG